MKNYKLLLIILISFQFSLFAQTGEGGMWMPNTIKQVESDMQKMGMTLTADEIWDTSKPSIKDAIVQLGNGCTAEVMSNKALLFTNHHCGYDAIQKMSTVEHNYLDDGFWAKSFDEEMPADGLTVTFIDDIIDVTSKVLAGVSDDLKPSERQSLVDKNIATLNKATPQDKFHNIKIKPFFKGNKYFMIKRSTFTDIRLVGTPPASLGKFGGDTDNWMWPRHTADFSIFRVYANDKNEPADYSDNNKPYTPKYSLKISLADLEEEDFTMVVGFPGRTTEYLTSYAVQHIQDIANPAKVKVRENTLAVMDKRMANDPALKLKLASKHASLANYWKFWIGESQGLKRFKAIEAKETFEKDFTNRLNKNAELKVKYGNVLPRLKELYTELKPYVAVQSYASEIFGRNIDLPSIVNISGMLIERSKAQGEPYYKAVKGRFKDYILNNTIKDFDADTDKEVFAALMDVYTKNVDSKYISKELSKALKNKSTIELANEIYNNSGLTSKENIEALFANETSKDFAKALKKDPAYKLFAAQQELIDNEVSTPVNKINAEINNLMGKYMKAQMEVFSDKVFYPDANFTMRVAYGRVKGFEPRDAVFYEPRTHLSGVIEKYIPNDNEFDLPQGIISLYNAKDYGRYAAKDGTLVTDFLATNHITGGNSGSPILDKDGNHIGLAFDGVWEGVMEDVYYRPEIARSIHVKDNYVLFIIDKFAHSKHIMEELTIVEE
jgi:hypothetical protein